MYNNIKYIQIVIRIFKEGCLIVCRNGVEIVERINGKKDGRTGI